MNLSSKLAEFTVGFQLDAVPAKALENAKVAILDCLGVAVLATTQEIGTILLNFARNNVGTGPCTIWGTALKTTPRDAALINGTLAHGLDYDDRNHSSTYTLAASFAAAEARDLSGAKCLKDSSRAEKSARPWTGYFRNVPAASDRAPEDGIPTVFSDPSPLRVR